MSFDFMQLREIQLGEEKNIDTSCYADEKYMFLQMREIRKGLEKGVNVSLYLNPDYDWFQMEEIRKGLEREVDVKIYANKGYDYLTMRELRKGLENGINLRPFVKKGYSNSVVRQVRKAQEAGIVIEKYVLLGYDSQQLEEIWKGIRDNLDIVIYMDQQFSGSQMKELRLGLLSKIDVSLYKNYLYNWMQMREVRLGLERGIKVFWYNNINYSARQMREIRLGLEEDKDVLAFVSYQWSATDMNRIRTELSQEIMDDELILDDMSEEEQLEAKYHSQQIEVMVSEDEMSATIYLPRPFNAVSYTERDVKIALESEGIKLGIHNDTIKEIVEKCLYEEEILIAEGKKCQDGLSGYYDYFFKTQLPRLPKILKDDSVDYQNVDFFETVTKGQKLAQYVPATNGTYGYTVRGKMITPKKGHDLPKLRGKGTQVEDGVTYYANIDGRVEIKALNLNVYPMYVYDGDVTTSVGNIRFSGDIYIKGNVGAGVTLETSGDLVVDGNIESNYILNSETVSMKTILISGRKGVITGGRTYAVAGVEAYSIGNQAEVKTYFEIGKNQYFKRKLKEMRNKKSQALKEVEVYKKEFDKYQATRSANELRELSIFQNISMAMIEANKQADKIEAEIQIFEKNSENPLKPAVLGVMGYTFPGCIVKIDDSILVVREKVAKVVFRKEANRVAAFTYYLRPAQTKGLK